MGKLSSRQSRISSDSQAVQTPASEHPVSAGTIHVWNWSCLLSVLLGGVALWAAFPPLGWYALAWLAPLSWLYWLRQPKFSVKLYATYYLAGLLFWLPTLQGIRLPHWALYFGWVVLSAYLAAYLPLWVFLTRWSMHRAGWPMTLAAPTAWVVLEWVRGQGPLGFSAALLGHTQLQMTALIQVADLAGGYLVSYLVMTVAACGLELMVAKGRRRWTAALLAALVLTVSLLYGAWRLRSPSQGPVILRAALIQANYDTRFEYNPERNLRMFEDYLRVAEKAVEEYPQVQLVIWPESAFSENNPCWIITPPIVPPPGSPWSEEQYLLELQARQAAFYEKCRQVARRLQPAGKPHGVWQIVGTEVVELHRQTTDTFNTALLLDPQGEIRGRYDKMHLVVFGEYLPLGRWFPWLYRWSPLRSGVTAGRSPAAFPVSDCTIAPNICFESTVPHLIRRQLWQLQKTGRSADVLVNITHDGWFWGSSILDLHLACSAFRAVENRRPMLMAANPGITAWIDGNGRIVRQLPRRAVDYLIAEVVRDSRSSPYTYWGDLPVIIAALSLPVTGLIRRLRRHPPRP